MKLVVVLALCLLVCYIHVTSSEPSGTKKQATKKDPKSKPVNGPTSHSKPKEKHGAHGKHPTSQDGKKAKRTPQIRTPFDKVLEKLMTCATSSPSLVEVMESNLKDIQNDEKYQSLFKAAPHTAAYLKKNKNRPEKFIPGLQQALSADWSSPAWKSADEIETLFRPLKQQFVYAMMRFNCTS
ncbi:unnamed protein product [Adineta ricciae]|uniref:Uncharacterized protein n=1 Tax=Adineta ricciae TaxID=249248 RepID=A0A814H4F3_ADIRI|nr:unnamed protein product [Adineta ricciae]CAF1005007.1 unnamed protein product [Adineta ricciae]